MSGPIPQEVLGESLQEKIAGRPVRAAVFTTFTFDPGFFELHVLPTLFDFPFHQTDKVKRVQLEDKLQGADVSVYYDRTGLSQDALPAQLDFRRIDVKRRTGIFHPKIVLILVENPSDEEDDELEHASPALTLIVGALSANLTRSGWWENVETGHFEEIDDFELDERACSFRPDVLSLIRRLRQTAPDDDDPALDRIHDFVRNYTSTDDVTRNKSNKRWYSRLFVGQSSLSEWFIEVGLGRQDWNLEIISPYFDGSEARALNNLIEAIEPRETRVHLPKDRDGEALVKEELYESVRESATWGTLPTGILQGGRRSGTEKTVPRRVHAKVYRFWRRDAEVIVTGSPNLTMPGHSHAGAGNLEAAFLVDRKDAPGRKSWWLSSLDDRPPTFRPEPPDEAEDCQPTPIDVTLRYDWVFDTLAYRLDTEKAAPFEVAEAAGRLLFQVEKPQTGDWVDCGERAAELVRELLLSTSFLLIRQGERNWRVLVREEGMLKRPSVLNSLTPEDILLYWSLLTPTQQAAFIEEKLAADGTLEGLPVRKGERYLSTNTVFDRFSGLYHAFEQLRAMVVESIEEDRLRAARAKLFGVQYDSLPELLRKVWSRDERDPIIAYVTFLSAQQVRDRICEDYPEFWEDYGHESKDLDELLEHRVELRDTLPLEDREREKFLNWYERQFLMVIEQPAESS